MRRSFVQRVGAAIVAVGLVTGTAVGATAAPAPESPSTPAPAAVLPMPAMPVDLTRLYVEAVYLDLFDREVDPAGLATWTGQLMAGTPRRAVADAITGSDEYRGNLIRWAYLYYLDREPDAAGMAHWLQMMRQGMTIQQIESYFLGSPEFFVEVGGTNESFITALYIAVLGRVPSISEGSFWLAAMTAPRSPSDRMTREQVALGFLMSWERLTADVDGEYQWLLGRGLDPSGNNTWVTQLQRGTRYEAVIGSIIASDEYLAYIQTWM